MRLCFEVSRPRSWKTGPKTYDKVTNKESLSTIANRMVGQCIVQCPARLLTSSEVTFIEKDYFVVSFFLKDSGISF